MPAHAQGLAQSTVQAGHACSGMFDQGLLRVLGKMLPVLSVHFRNISPATLFVIAQGHATIVFIQLWAFPPPATAPLLPSLN